MIRSLLIGLKVRFLIAGISHSIAVRKLACEDIEVLGRVDDLYRLFDRTRVFVAPIRFAAGIPIKVLDAAAHGVPFVVTQLVADQLGWEDEREALVNAVSDAQGFARNCARLYTESELWYRLRANALERIHKDYSPDAFDASLGEVLESAVANSPVPRHS